MSLRPKQFAPVRAHAAADCDGASSLRQADLRSAAQAVPQRDLQIATLDLDNPKALIQINCNED